MKVYDEIEQGTQQWLDLKKGVISGSEVGAWVTAEKRCVLTIPEIKKLLDVCGVAYSKTAKKSELEPLLPTLGNYMEYTQEVKEAKMKLISLKLAEISGEEMQPFFSNWSMERGKALEPEARRAYEEETGNKVEQVGFVMHDNGLMGVSPDGLTRNRKVGTEIKCLLPQNHVRYLLKGTIPEEYIPQISMQMAICELEAVDFYCYCPSLPSLLLRIKRDNSIDGMLSGLLRLCDEYKDQKAVMKTKWDEMKARYDLKNRERKHQYEHSRGN